MGREDTLHGLMPGIAWLPLLAQQLPAFRVQEHQGRNATTIPVIVETAEKP
jgi:hypothetical protein